MVVVVVMLAILPAAGIDGSRQVVSCRTSRAAPYVGQSATADRSSSGPARGGEAGGTEPG
jgi:hypothetical protein